MLRPSDPHFARFVLSIAISLGIAAWLLLGHPSWFAMSVEVTPTATPTEIIPDDTPTPRPIPPTAVPTPVPPREEPHVGDVQHLDNVWITLVGVSESHGDVANQPNIGDVFVTVYLDIQNRSNVPYTVNSSHYYILDSFGQQDPHISYDPTHRHLRDLTLIPGGHTFGTLTFETPAHDLRTRLVYQPDFLDLTKQKVWWLHWCGKHPC